MNHIPSKQDILAWIADHPGETSKREIAKAFGIKGAARIDLKRILKELETEGHIDKRRKKYRDPNKLPPISALQVTGPDGSGDLFAKPLEWFGDTAEPKVLVLLQSGRPALGSGDRILARLTEVEGEAHNYEARIIRRIVQNQKQILGVFRKTSEGGRIVPIDKGAKREWAVPNDGAHGALDGELVEAEQAGPNARIGLPYARVVTRLGNPSEPKSVSLIAIHQHGIPDDFPDSVITEADRMKSPGLGGREDLRDIPLVTIDPVDARDHDDAVWAHLDDDPKNKGGHVIWVAIADVAHFVRPGSALDREARLRGNSNYFPDRVVPMLPDRLSGDLCSLHENVPRACVAVRIQIDSNGRKIGHRFTRGFMRSVGSLNYEEVQAAVDGNPNDKCAPLFDDVIAPLFSAWRTTMKARAERQPLDLVLPERKIELSEAGRVKSVSFQIRLDVHQLIEEFMVLANVAAAEELEHQKTPLVYRVHEEPSPEKLEALRKTAKSSGLILAKGQVPKTSHLNHLLTQSQGTQHNELINMATLRSMMQAYYHPENYGHFGLALRRYARFTSPIRRYADLVVHRALISAHGWGKDGLTADEIEQLGSTAEHISETERRSMTAERDTTDRYLAAYLSEQVGAEMTGRISGIQRFGAFVRLGETGADGLIPIRSIGTEYFYFDSEAHTLSGSDTGLTLTVGQSVTVRLVQAVPVTGGLVLKLLSAEGTQVSQVAQRHSESKKKKTRKTRRPSPKSAKNSTKDPWSER